MKSGEEQTKEGVTEVADKTTEKTGKGEKVNPWKLIDEYKKKLASAEKAQLESKQTSLAETEKKSLEERITKAEQRAQDLENEIRYVNYSKSQEYQDIYVTPYEEAWKKAASDLAEITVVDGEGQAPRAATAEDLLNLVNLPLGKARELANAMFGDFADDAMSHRKEIRGLFDQQQKALKEAREAGAQRDAQRSESVKKEFGDRAESVKNAWNVSNDKILSDPKYGEYFRPVEGDEDGNQRLAKGFQLADRAFTENPMAPGLTADQRRSIVERHAAVRNRCAAFGRLVFQNNKLKGQIDELKKQLSDYQGSEPGNGQTARSQTPVTGSARDRMFGELRKKAVTY